MKKILLLVALVSPLTTFCQTKPQPTSVTAHVALSPAADEKAIRAIIKQLFDGMRKSDTVMVRNAFVPAARIQSIIQEKNREITIRQESVSNFVNAVGSPHKDAFDERIHSMDIKIDTKMASAWAPYTFYLGQKINHCGVNNFTLLRTLTGWKIFTIIDTRRKEPCK